MLDPTCGSGAFLFAALNVLQPLYDPCLDCMAVLVQQVYRNARYDLQVDYQAASPLPDLSHRDAAWLDAHLRAVGVRALR